MIYYIFTLIRGGVNMITLNVTGNKDNGVVRAFLGLSKDTKPIRWFQDSVIPGTGGGAAI